MSYLLDHRQLADEMEICFFQNDIGPGLPVWLPNGVAIREELERFVREAEDAAGYIRVVSPHLARGSLYEKSGHLAHFAENMFPPMSRGDCEPPYYLRPMNCPHHHHVFASSLRSYRDLPLRIAEYGQVYRYENSGSLRGLGRVRGLCQNDAHIYVAPQDALSEIRQVLRLHESCYRALGLKYYKYRLSKHASDISSREKERWLECEGILRQALQDESLEFFEAPGEAAFYGPKIDVQMQLGRDREESMASIQLDFMSAERFSLVFGAPSGRLEQPWIIHRAPLGSHERFIAMLLEYFDGLLPGWLSPVQLLVIPVGNEQDAYCAELSRQLRSEGFRVRIESGQGSLSKRLRQGRRFRPFARLVIGPNEVLSGRLGLIFRDRELQVPRANINDLLRKFLARPRMF